MDGGVTYFSHLSSPPSRFPIRVLTEAFQRDKRYSQIASQCYSQLSGISRKKNSL